VSVCVLLLKFRLARMGSKLVDMHLFNSLFSNNLGKPVPHKLHKITILDYNEARDDCVAVASAGPYVVYCMLMQR